MKIDLEIIVRDPDNPEHTVKVLFGGCDSDSLLEGSDNMKGTIIALTRLLLSNQEGNFSVDL